MSLSFQRRDRLTCCTILAVALAVFCWATVQAKLAPPDLFDAAVRAWVQSHEIKIIATFLWMLTQTGSPEFIACVALFAGWREHKRGNASGAILIAITVMGALVLNETLKHVFHRARPSPFFGMAVPASYSYPSGHALWSASFYGLFVPGRMRLTWIALIAAIGFSRIYLGVHYPTDVAGGLAVGVGWVAAVMLVFNGRLSA